jgi:hypothetical protein
MHHFDQHPRRSRLSAGSLIERVCRLETARWVAFALGASALPLVLQAQPSAHLCPGMEGIEGASLPPPGVYLKDYTAVYSAGQLNDATGNEIDGIGAKAFCFANVPRLIWITDTKVLGGNLGFDLVLPVKYTSVRVDAAGFDSSTWGVGDPLAEVAIPWHTTQFDTVVGYGIWIPSGTSATGLNTEPGSGFWTNMLTAGATWHIDANRTWALSLLDRYEISGRQRGSDFTPGDTDTLEWGLSYAPAKILTLGLAGYFQGQFTRSTGAGSSPNRSNVVGVGPEVDGIIPVARLFWSLRWIDEVEARSRFQGETTVLAITKIF